MRAIKCIYFAEYDVLEEPENIDQEAKPIAETLQIHKVNAARWSMSVDWNYII